MTIKTGRIRRLYDEALQKSILSDNMLLMAVSALNNEICFNNKLTDKQVAVYQEYRKIIAKTAINNGISKSKLTATIQTLSPERYPSLHQITQLITLIQNKSYSYQAEYIPESDMKYRTATELQEQQQKVIKRNQAQIEHEQQFNEICDCISNSFDITITADMQAKIRTIKANNDIILSVIRWYEKDIYRALQAKGFHSQFDKLIYIVGIIKKKAPETKERLEYRKRKEEEFLNNTDFSRVNSYINNFEPKPERKRKKNYDDMW